MLNEESDVLPGKRILVVEDNELTLKIIKRFLEGWGYEVVHSSDGNQAWELLQREKFSMVLLDWMMPGMDGITICRKLREKGGEEFIYIIMVTSKDCKEDIIAGFDAGADDYVTKPFDPDVFHSRINVGWRIVELEHNLAVRIRDLQTSLAQVKQLQGLLPICCYCKRIRKDSDYWEQVEKYITQHSEARFSHGICPECYEKYVVPTIEQYKKEKKEE